MLLFKACTTADKEYTIKGIDVSRYQLDINWEGLVDDDVTFAYIKATEGRTYVDPKYAENREGADAAGIYAGAYHFVSYDVSGEAQAENFINTVEKKRGALPPAVDVEFYGKYSSHHPSAEKMYDVLDPLLEALEDRYGKKPIIYTNRYIYGTYISPRYEHYPIWISDKEMRQPLPDGKEWTICQYTFTGYSNNIANGEKYVDFNVFNGGKLAFRLFR